MDENQDKLYHLHGSEVPFPPKISRKNDDLKINGEAFLGTHFWMEGPQAARK